MYTVAAIIQTFIILKYIDVLSKIFIYYCYYCFTLKYIFHFMNILSSNQNLKLLFIIPSKLNVSLPCSRLSIIQTKAHSPTRTDSTHSTQ